MSFVPTIPLRLSEEDYFELERLAKKLSVDSHTLATNALREFLSDCRAEDVALERINDPMPPISLNEMRRRLSH